MLIRTGMKDCDKFLEGMATSDQNGCALLADPFIVKFTLGDLEEVTRTVSHRFSELCEYKFA